MSTRSRASTAASVAARRPRPWWTRTISAIWLPTVKAGFRLVSGSWKIIAISRPRMARIAPGGRSTSSRPSKPDGTGGDASGPPGEEAHQGQGGDRLAAAALAHQGQGAPRREGQVHALDHPDPTVAPGELDAQVPHLDQAVGPVGAAVGLGFHPRRPGHRPGSAQRVPQAVTDQVEGQHREGDRRARARRSATGPRGRTGTPSGASGPRSRWAVAGRPRGTPARPRPAGRSRG